MEKINRLSVFYHERKVGTLALHKNNLIAFEYEKCELFNKVTLNPENAENRLSFLNK